MQRLEGGRGCIGGSDINGELATYEDHYPVDKPVDNMLTDGKQSDTIEG